MSEFSHRTTRTHASSDRRAAPARVPRRKPPARASAPVSIVSAARIALARTVHAVVRFVDAPQGGFEEEMEESPSSSRARERKPLSPSDSSDVLDDLGDLDDSGTDAGSSVLGTGDVEEGAVAAHRRASSRGAHAAVAARGDADDDDAADASDASRPRGSSRRPRADGAVRQIHAHYETPPWRVWARMLAQLLASALATAGLALRVGVYPLYAITPTPVLEFLAKSAFNVGYLIYMTPLGRWLHLRMVRERRDSNAPPHSRGVRPSQLSTCSVLPVPFLNDNYMYLLVDHATRDTAAIDPADPYTMASAAKRLNLKIVAILTTHKHHDHAGGNLALQKQNRGRLRVYGHAKDRIPGVTCAVKAGDTLRVGETEIGVLHLPCHTTGHVAYAVLGERGEAGGGGGGGGGGGAGGGASEDGGGGAGRLPVDRVEALFTGDAIINGGVGAFFHGGPRDCYENLHMRLRAIPDAALVFSGHEYMMMNLRFARWLDDEDESTAMALREVIIRRNHALSTMPSSMAVERAVNPYFRVGAEAGYLEKIHALRSRVEAGKAKRWYAKYVGPTATKILSGARSSSEVLLSETAFDGVGPGGGPGAAAAAGGGGASSAAAPSAAASARGIKALQELSQYRHLLDDDDESVDAESESGGRRSRRASRAERDGEEGEKQRLAKRRGPAPVSVVPRAAGENGDAGGDRERPPRHPNHRG